jgi:hypothetical protein
LPAIAITDAAGNQHQVRVAEGKFAADEIVWIRLACCDSHSGQCFRDARAGGEYNLEISGVHTLELADIDQKITDAAQRLADSHAVEEWQRSQVSANSLLLEGPGPATATQ